MQTIAVFEALKFDTGKTLPVSDHLAVEEALQICINAIPYTITMRTPGDDFHLVRGLLYTEGLYTDLRNSFEDFSESQKNENDVPLLVNVKIDPNKIKKEYQNTRGIMSVSSCGLCGKRDLKDIEISGEKIDSKNQLQLSSLAAMFERMNSQQFTFQQSGGAHASAAFNVDGKLLAIKEDIGRHNAVDKVIGALIESQVLEQASILLVSGRISYEIVTKAFMARIPFLAAVSAPSSLSVETAEAVGICIIGFCRDHTATVYSMRNRIREEN